MPFDIHFVIIAPSDKSFTLLGMFFQNLALIMKLKPKLTLIYHFICCLGNCIFFKVVVTVSIKHLEIQHLLKHLSWSFAPFCNSFSVLYMLWNCLGSVEGNSWHLNFPQPTTSSTCPLPDCYMAALCCWTGTNTVGYTENDSVFWKGSLSHVFPWGIVWRHSKWSFPKLSIAGLFCLFFVFLGGTFF